ncbi:MAG: FAD-dependent oxidoreductase, partial [Deltaproteobacteria bacterium]
ADPEWAQKGEEGRFDEIRPCIGCLQGCMDLLFSGQPLGCLTNPQAGLEKERALKRTRAPKKVVVVGAGPAGLEAACTAARRGHRVTLIEKQDSIGGQLHLAAAPPGRQEFITLLPYYHRQLKNLGVNLKLGKEATVGSLKRMATDALILAAGAEPLLPEIPGIDLPRVCTAWDVLRGEADLGRKVVIIGGGAVGVETALYIAAQGTISGETLKFLLIHEAEDFETLREICRKGTREVTLIEQLPKIGQDIGVFSRWVLLKEISFFGVRSLTEARVKEIRTGEVVYEKDGRESVEPGDSVVLALGSRPLNALAETLTRAGVSFKEIGDCRDPRKVIDAIQEGFTAAQEL